MAGNVWEWTATDVGGEFVSRGGSWAERNPANLRAAVRRLSHPETAHSDDGFRCARSVEAWPAEFR